MQAIKNIPIYAKTIKDLCLKKTGRKKKEAKIVQVKGHLASLMSTSITMEKYIDPGVPLVTISINSFSIPNTLIDLGATINVMTIETLRNLKIYNIRPTPTILELVDRSKVKPEGVVDDVIVSIDSWEYPVNLIILQPKSNLGGHPLILGRLWLTTVDAFIGCRVGPMIISKENEGKQISLYPPAKSITELEHMS